MNDVADGLADSYSVAQQAGKKEIGRSWRGLRPDTRAWLTSTGHYDDRGGPLEADGATPELEDLEYNLGLINRCVAAKLRGPLKTGAPIPREALNSDVLGELSGLIRHPFGQDPVFLRRPLLALRSFEMAHLLNTLPTAKEHSSWRGAGVIAFWLFCFVLLLLTPAILAKGLVSAAKNDYGDTSAALYGLGFAAWMLNILRNAGKPTAKTKDEQTYLVWLALQGDWTVGGAGASAYFEEMMRKGLQVPLIAFDLCESLKTQSLRQCT
jgi:hypothetical protein